MIFLFCISLFNFIPLWSSVFYQPTTPSPSSSLLSPAQEFTSPYSPVIKIADLPSYDKLIKLYMPNRSLDFGKKGEANEQDLCYMEFMIRKITELWKHHKREQIEEVIAFMPRIRPHLQSFAEGLYEYLLDLKRERTFNEHLFFKERNKELYLITELFGTSKTTAATHFSCAALIRIAGDRYKALREEKYQNASKEWASVHEVLVKELGKIFTLPERTACLLEEVTKGFQK